MSGEEHDEPGELREGDDSADAPRLTPPGQRTRRVPDTLVCPDCRYNLTGLCTEETPKGNCPECGKPFSRDHLVALATAPAPPLGRAVGGLFLWPAVATAFMLLAFPMESGALVIIGLAFWVLGGIVQSAYLAIRITEQKRYPDPPFTPLGKILLALTLTAVFIALELFVGGFMIYAGCMCMVSSF